MSDEISEVVRRRFALPVSWRLFTELVRRHGTTHALRVVQTHPGASVAGQLVLLVNPRPETILDCPQLVLNVGGPTGTYDVRVSGSSIASGDYLWPTLAGGFGQVLNAVERCLGWQAPSSLPASSNQMLTMRLVAEVLSAMWLDRRQPAIEFAFFDWSGGCKVRSWSRALGVDVVNLQRLLDTGEQPWASVCLSVSGFFRLTIATDEQSANEGWVFDMDAGRACWTHNDQAGEVIHLPDAYKKSHRRLEPIAASLLARLRQA